jgi:hypothetical protein
MYESGRPEADYLGGLGVGAPPEKRGERREEKRREERGERRGERGVFHLTHLPP